MQLSSGVMLFGEVVASLRQVADAAFRTVGGVATVKSGRGAEGVADDPFGAPTQSRP